MEGTLKPASPHARETGEQTSLPSQVILSWPLSSRSIRVGGEALECELNAKFLYEEIRAAEYCLCKVFLP